jgi:hypothetical protein
MMTKNLKQCLVMLPVIFLLLTGCASTNGKAKVDEGPQYSGFLSDYSKLEPDPDGSKAMRYRNPQADMGKYKKIMIDKIVISLKSDAEYKAIDPDEMKTLTDYFRESIVKELGSDYPVVNQAGPDVLRARIAITDLVPTKTAVTVLVLITPYATVADLASSAGSKGGAGSPPYLGHAAVEVEGIDSETLQPVFSYVEQRFSKKYDAEKPTAYFDAYSTWAYVKNNFDYWAKKFRTRMDEAHGKKKAEDKK